MFNTTHYSILWVIQSKINAKPSVSNITDISFKSVKCTSKLLDYIQNRKKELFLLVKTCHLTVLSKFMTTNCGDFPKNIFTEEKHEKLNV